MVKKSFYLFSSLFSSRFISDESPKVPDENIIHEDKPEQTTGLFYSIKYSLNKTISFKEPSPDVDTKQVERESKEPSSEPQYKDAEKATEDEQETYDDNDSEYEDVDEEEEEIEEKHDTSTSNKPPVKVKRITKKKILLFINIFNSDCS
jgi:hypothetical protein